MFGDLEYKSKNALPDNHINSMDWLDKLTLEYQSGIPENMLQCLTQPYIRDNKRLAIGSNDPITAIARGGLVDLSGRYRWMPLSRENDIIIEAFSRLPIIYNTHVAKIDSEKPPDPKIRDLIKITSIFG